MSQKIRSGCRSLTLARASNPSGLSLRRELAIRPLVPQHECHVGCAVRKTRARDQNGIVGEDLGEWKKEGQCRRVTARATFASLPFSHELAPSERGPCGGCRRFPLQHIRRRGRRHRACSRHRWSVVALQKDKGFSIANPQKVLPLPEIALAS